MKKNFLNISSIIIMLLFICLFSSCNKQESDNTHEISKTSGNKITDTRPSDGEVKGEIEAWDNIRAEKYIEAGEYENAVAYCNDITKSNTENPDVYKVKIAALSKMGETDKSIFMEAYKDMGKALLGMEKYNESAEAFTKSIELAGENPSQELLLGRSFAYMKLGEEKKAAADMKKATEISSDKGYTYLLHAGGCIMVNMEDEALKSLEEYAKLNPDINKNSVPDDSLSKELSLRKSLYYSILAEAQMETGEYKKAADNYVKAMQADPKLYITNKDISLNLGLAYLMAGNKQKASEHADKWLKEKVITDSPEDNENIAITALIKGNRDEALSQINKALKEKPEKAGYYITRGIINQYTDHEKEAKADYEKAAEISKRKAEKTRAGKHLQMLKQ